MIIVKCDRCSLVLYKGNSLISVENIVKRKSRNFKCPRCYKKLSFTGFNIQVRPARGRA